MSINMINWLKEYIQNTPPDVLKKEWSEIEEIQSESPLAFEYLDFLDKWYNLHYPELEIQCIKTNNSYSPEISGFFFANIAA